MKNKMKTWIHVRSDVNRGKTECGKPLDSVHYTADLEFFKDSEVFEYCPKCLKALRDQGRI